MEARDPGSFRAAKGSHASAVVTSTAQASLYLFLSHGPSARRGQKLVHAANRGTRTANDRAWARGAALRRRSEADHHWIDRFRRLGVGSRFVGGRSAGVQEIDLRDAI